MDCGMENEKTKKNDKYILQCKRKKTDNFKCNTKYTMYIFIITDQCISEQVGSLKANPLV